MSIGTQTCEITLPGYVLTERIGSGGYAEVWRAEAPGGIEKAVKVVYGFYDDELASQELKALERIKGVRHPFLLSLERFEVINGRLAILTELADMSLEQRLRQCRAEGLSGIPRDELLRYMADAAEALDFLAQRHNLLHLDVKPENLLVLGDHVKVADFGLVKELTTRTQNSLVSGLTPTYASPEMFDDEPSAHSDQYSLAVVYQEMLVGTLPFPGRTAAQLAKQHMLAEPQLASLPAADRTVVARALAKKPEERFPSCREFINSLLQLAAASPWAAPAKEPLPAPSTPRPSEPSLDDTRPPSLCTTLRRSPENAPEQPAATVTQPVQRRAQSAPLSSLIAAPRESGLSPKGAASPETHIPEDIVDGVVPEPNPDLRREQPTLYVAIGGVGIQVLCRLRALSNSRTRSDADNDAVETVAIDTDRNELREACSARWTWPLATEDTLHLPLRLPKSYDDSREVLDWLSRRWLYNIPRSLETRGYRPLGRVALVDHSRRVLSLIDQKLERLATFVGAPAPDGVPRDSTVRVVLLAGTGGGTGSGMVLDVANAVKFLAAGRNLAVEVQGYLLSTCVADHRSSPLNAANTYALISELSHATTYGNVGTSDKPAQLQAFDSAEPPFNHVYCVPLQTRSSDVRSADTLDIVARYLALEECAVAREVLRSCRQSQTPREQSRGRALTLRKLGCVSLANEMRVLIHELAAELSVAVKRHWLRKDTATDWARLIHEAKSVAALPPSETAGGDETNTSSRLRPAPDVTPLGLRAEFEEHMSLEFTSEVLQSIQSRLAARDERGRPLIVPGEAKLIAIAARDTVASIAACSESEPPSGSRFTDSPALRPLIAAVSRRVIDDAVNKFDSRQPEPFLSAGVLDELIQSECRELLEQAAAQPDTAADIESLVDLDAAAARTLSSATIDLLQCGSDRRTLVLVPKERTEDEAVAKLRAARSTAAVVAADIDDILVVADEAGISARSLVLGIERVLPGIADAAHRLFTRMDISWQSAAASGAGEPAPPC